jgi:hypothetical protein
MTSDILVKPPLTRQKTQWILMAARWFLPPTLFTSLCHFRIYGRLRLFKNPETFNELVSHKKLYDKNPLYIKTSDKYLVRSYVEEWVGSQYLVPLLYVTDDATTINLDTLPQSFVLKATHGSGWNLFVRDKNVFDWDMALITMKEWLQSRYYHEWKEWAYIHVKPQILIEEMLNWQDGRAPADYKIYVFNGRARLIELHTGRFVDHRVDHFDENWRELAVTALAPPSSRVHMKPPHLDEMLWVAETLGRPFEFARVDLYSQNGKIYFGEITHYPCGGMNIFQPRAFDKALGALWCHGSPLPEEFFVRPELRVSSAEVE